MSDVRCFRNQMTFKGISFPKTHDINNKEIQKVTLSDCTKTPQPLDPCEQINSDKGSYGEGCIKLRISTEIEQFNS